MSVFFPSFGFLDWLCGGFFLFFLLFSCIVFALSCFSFLFFLSFLLCPFLVFHFTSSRLLALRDSGMNLHLPFSRLSTVNGHDIISVSYQISLPDECSNVRRWVWVPAAKIRDAVLGLESEERRQFEGPLYLVASVPWFSRCFVRKCSGALASCHAVILGSCLLVLSICLFYLWCSFSFRSRRMDLGTVVFLGFVGGAF